MQGIWEVLGVVTMHGREPSEPNFPLNLAISFQLLQDFLREEDIL